MFDQFFFNFMEFLFIIFSSFSLPYYSDFFTFFVSEDEAENAKNPGLKNPCSL